MGLVLSAPNFLGPGETFADETFTAYFDAAVAPAANQMLFAAVMGPTPSISGPTGVTWLPCGSNGRVACFYALADSLAIPAEDEAYRVTINGRIAQIHSVTDVDTTIGPLVNFADGDGTLLDTGDPTDTILQDVENGPTSYDSYWKMGIAGVWHDAPAPNTLGVYAVPDCITPFGVASGFSGAFNLARSFPGALGFPEPDPLPENQERDEFLGGAGYFEGCGDFLTGFEVGSDTSDTPGSYYLVTAYFLRPGAGTCAGGGEDPDTGGDKAVANLQTPFRLFLRAWINAGQVLVSRADYVVPPFSSTGAVAEPGPAATHPDLYRDGQRVFLLYQFGGNALRRYSDDDGATWSASEVAFTGGKYPRGIADPLTGTILEYAYVGGVLKGRRRGPGETTYGAEFLVTGLGALANSPFGVAWGYDPQSRVVLSINTGSQVTEYQSFDDGVSFAAVP